MSKNFINVDSIIELKEIDAKFVDLQKTLNWVINGLGLHGLKISDVSRINWSWIVENYNVDDYVCKHKKVSEISSVVAFADNPEKSNNLLEKYYSGYCDVCGKTVQGSTNNGKIVKGWH